MNYIGPKVYIDLTQLVKNYHLLSDQVGNIPIMATVKANGYGHGAVQVSKALEAVSKAASELEDKVTLVETHIASLSKDDVEKEVKRDKAELLEEIE